MFFKERAAEGSLLFLNKGKQGGSMKVSLDAVGIWASFICAVHCALLPLLFMALPLTGMKVFHNEILDFALIGTSFTVGCFALLRGYKKHHHKKNPLLLFSLGFPILVIAHFFLKKEASIIVITIAAVLIIAAHLINWNAIRTKHHCAH
jgi:hypothetical protein